MKTVKKVKNILKRPRKHHLDYVAAILGIPFMLLLIYVNVTNLQNKNKPESTPPAEKIIIEREKEAGSSGVNQIVVTPKACKKEIGPISISFPKEGQRIEDNPVSFTIKYDDDAYCSVVWSYRINGGAWSEYSSNSPSVYNMPKGNIKFELRVQSTVSSDQESLVRNFIYEGTNNIPLPTSATSSSELK